MFLWPTSGNNISVSQLNMLYENYTCYDKQINTMIHITLTRAY